MKPKPHGFDWARFKFCKFVAYKQKVVRYKVLAFLEIKCTSRNRNVECHSNLPIEGRLFDCLLSLNDHRDARWSECKLPRNLLHHRPSIINLLSSHGLLHDLLASPRYWVGLGSLTISLFRGLGPRDIQVTHFKNERLMILCNLLRIRDACHDAVIAVLFISCSLGANPPVIHWSLSSS